LTKQKKGQKIKKLSKIKKIKTKTLIIINSYIFFIILLFLFTIINSIT
jgi:hypothetical protein